MEGATEELRDIRTDRKRLLRAAKKQRRLIATGTRRKANEWRNDASELRERAVNELDQLITSCKTLQRECQASMKALEEVYAKKLSLQAPVKYWRSKMQWHVGFSIGFGLLFVAGLGGLGYWLSIETALLLAPDAGTPPLWKIIRGAVFVFLGVWLLHILAKLTLSMVHLVADASERRTMTMTYLALVEKQAVGDSEREIVLRSLFRPTTTGIFKDAGGPPLIQMVSSIKKES